MTSETFHCYQQSELIYRLSRGLARRDQSVVFLVGAALSAPSTDGGPGVLSTEGLIELVRQEFIDDPVETGSLEKTLGVAKEKRYQEAFLFLQGRLGQTAINDLVKRAVLGARRPGSYLSYSGQSLYKLSDDELRLIDLDQDWILNAGTESLGKLVSQYPSRFGGTVLTTNFDPLVEVAIRRSGGDCYKTALHADGNLGQTEARGCHVVHLHGYWFGSDTLHTVGQLQRSRPHLKASLASLLRNKIIVVCGYGGWDDVFTDALFDVVSDDGASPEILWAFHRSAPSFSEHLENRIASGIGRGRVSLYSGVDCNEFFPSLYQAWTKIEHGAPRPELTQTNQVHLRGSLKVEFESVNPLQRMTGDDEDRPPMVDVCVGRDLELQSIRNSSASVIFVTGTGGQGKSTLVAEYFSAAEGRHEFEYCVWRDCKEESERFENQLASIVETLSGGQVSGRDLSNQAMTSIVALFIRLVETTSVLLVFDNADHYVNLTAERMTSSADVLIDKLLSTDSKCRVIFTCRPVVEYGHSRALSVRLQGITRVAAHDLFQARGALCTSEELSGAHAATEGHPFWLDLLAIQTAKPSSPGLLKLLQKLEATTGTLEEKALSSLWEILSDREKLVLRAMAEAVRPETDSEIADHLHPQVKYTRAKKAMHSLKAMNLLVVKRRTNARDVYELHPLLRNFIRNRFSQPERYSFIHQIIRTYNQFINSNRAQLTGFPTFTTLQYWTHTAELDIAAGRIADAILMLLEAADAFSSSGYAREFCRVVRILLNAFDWRVIHGKYKGFDLLFSRYVKNLVHLGQWSEADQLLGSFELTVAERDSRYLLFCDLKCFSEWYRGGFNEAIRWGREGENLKKTSNVDTKYDVSHNLALAERDAGRPEIALPIFLLGRNLDEVVDPDEFDEQKDGTYYGNIGRCLHFMGQITRALICYQKSALLIERESKGERVLNQGYVRRWVGELLLARNEHVLAGIFLEAARLKWEQVSPPRADEIAVLQTQLSQKLGVPPRMSKQAIERKFLDWISGDDIDAHL